MIHHPNGMNEVARADSFRPKNQDGFLRKRRQFNETSRTLEHFVEVQDT
jgi:hypothetical protein